MVARWSKSHRWSKPDSSAIFQTVRSCSMLIHWPDALRPKRSGCGNLRLPFSENGAAARGWGADSGANTPRVSSRIPRSDRRTCGCRPGPCDPRLARDPNHDVAHLVGVEVELDVWVLAHVAFFDPRCGVDEERVAVK